MPTPDDVPGPLSGPDLARVGRFCQMGVDRIGVDAIAVILDNGVAGPDLLLATQPFAERAARLELAIGQGPTLDAMASGMVTTVDDLQGTIAEHRWPLGASTALGVEARALSAYPLKLARGRPGAVGLYSLQPRTFSSTQHRQAAGLSDLIALALAAPDVQAGIGSSLRMTSHQAAGMVMIQTGTTIRDALVLLRSTAFADDVQLTDLAAEVIARRRRFAEVGSE